MEAASISIVLLTVVLWGTLGNRAGSVMITAPIVFLVAGYVYVDVVGVIHLDVEAEPVKVLAEVTLAWVLFVEASAMNLHRRPPDLGTEIRLLGLGLPLTIGLGAVVASTLLGYGAWEALLVAAAVAATDAAMGAAVIGNPRVPARARRALSLESGLNDGIVLPIVMLAIAGVAADLGVEGVHDPGRAVVDLLVGALVGAVVGAVGGGLVREARRHGWLKEDLVGVTLLSLALLAFSTALVVDSNGFVAAFVAGLLFSWTTRLTKAREIEYVKETSSLASMLTWLVFGALALPTMGQWTDWRVFTFALLSLTLVRLLPIALSLVGSGLERAEVMVIGLFGARGLPSVIFALIVLENLHEQGRELVAAIALTVVLSVVMHGLAGGLLARSLTADRGSWPSARRTPRR